MDWALEKNLDLEDDVDSQAEDAPAEEAPAEEAAAEAEEEKKDE